MLNLKRGNCLVTGSIGMVGSAIKKLLGDYDILSPTRAELDLGDRQQVRSYFEKHRPEYVLMIAAKVGGIVANKSDPVGFLSEKSIFRQFMYLSS